MTSWGDIGAVTTNEAEDNADDVVVTPVVTIKQPTGTLPFIKEGSTEPATEAARQTGNPDPHTVKCPICRKLRQ